MVNGLMIIGLSLVALLLQGAIVFVVYVKGFTSGMRREANDWCSAFDTLRAPNWQSRPLPDASEEENKRYVQAYTAALHTIASELITSRVKALMASGWQKVED